MKFLLKLICHYLRNDGIQLASCRIQMYYSAQKKSLKTGLYFR